MKRSNAAARIAFSLAVTFALVFSSQAQSSDRHIITAQQKQTSAHAIHIVDQNGRPAVSGVPSGTGQIVDVTVAPGGTFTFSPSTVNISVGDTVRWTWAASGHSVTSGAPCTADGQFCSPNNTNCSQCVTSNQGFVYQFTFTQAGNFSYFCCVHCAFGMTGVVNVSAGSPTPTPTATATATPTATPRRQRHRRQLLRQPRRTIGDTAAHSHANGDGHSFANSSWKAQTDATSAPNTACASVTPVKFFLRELAKNFADFRRWHQRVLIFALLAKRGSVVMAGNRRWRNLIRRQGRTSCQRVEESPRRPFHLRCQSS